MVNRSMLSGKKLPPPPPQQITCQSSFRQNSAKRAVYPFTASENLFLGRFHPVVHEGDGLFSPFSIKRKGIFV